MPADAFAQKQAMMHRLQEQQEAFKVRSWAHLVVAFTLSDTSHVRHACDRPLTRQQGACF